jgi:intracellular multiplication protein IcmE
MGDKVNNVQAMMNNPKQRNIYLMGVGAAIVTLVAGFMYATSSSKSNAPAAGAQVAKIPSVNSVPGTSNSARYNENVAAANAKDAQKAIDEGKTFVPTPVNKDSLSTESPLDSLDKQIKAQKEAEAKEEAEKQAQAAANSTVNSVNNGNTVVQQPVQQVQMQAPVVVAPPKPAKKFGSDEDYVIMQAITGVSAIKAPKAEFDFAGQKSLNQSANQALANMGQVQSANNTAQKGQLIAKAGTIFNAVLETGINSDEPSPVLARIVSGDLKGTRLIGKIGLVGEKVVVTFNVASIPEMNTSIKLNSVAVDPNSSRTALASDVDRHYFLRYGVMLSAAFLGGYADAIKNNNQTCTTSTLGGTVCQPTGTLSSRQINQQAVGGMGKELANETKQTVSGLKPTITVDNGTPIGILIMDDLYTGQ